MANVWFRLLLALLATWRATHLLANEDGPADIIVRVRVWLGNRWIGQLMDCFNCLSLWIAAPVALFVTRRPVEWLFSWLALSGAACLLQQFHREQVVLETVSQLEEGEANHVLWKETHDDPDGNTSGTGNFGAGNNGSQHAGAENRHSLR
jgi:Protein of unknown function (DUF1360)